MSNVGTVITARFKLGDGTFVYKDIGVATSSSSYQNNSFRFVVPNGVVSLTVFHLLNQVGNLSTDEYALNEITAPTSQNLIQNGDFEIANQSGGPLSWKTSRWGTHTTNFIYPASGVSNSKAVKVTTTSYTNGDAKWYFNPIALSPGVYNYRESYIGTIPTYITIQYHRSDGTFFYKDLVVVPTAASFTPVSLNITVPHNVSDITIFHLIRGVGSLTVDNASLEFQSTFSGIFETGAVTLTFDDGLISQYENVVPKLNNAGFRGSFFIITRQLADYGYLGFMSKNQIAEIYNQGHEIAAHTRTHPASFNFDGGRAAS